MDDVPTEQILKFEKELMDFVQSRYSTVLETLKKEKKMSKNLEQRFEEVLQEFKAVFKG